MMRRLVYNEIINGHVALYVLGGRCQIRQLERTALCCHVNEDCMYCLQIWFDVCHIFSFV
jgi:hypothetical protein